MTQTPIPSLAGTETIKSLGANFVGFLSGMESGMEKEVRDEIESLAKLIDRFAGSSNSARYKYHWTAAVYVYLKHLAADPSRIAYKPAMPWTLYPREKPYAGEFITDFAVYEERYGFRIACESQWHEGKKNQTRICDAFAKLLHVKADLKLLLFESSHNENSDETQELFKKLREDYLNDYMHFETEEDYLLMQWDGKKVKLYLWQPLKSRALTPFAPNEIGHLEI